MTATLNQHETGPPMMAPKPMTKRGRQQARAAVTVRSHGASGYNLGCRCDICSSNHAERCRRVAQARKDAEIWNNPADPKHGTVNGYVNWYCRCDRCSPVGVKWNKARHAKRRAAAEAVKAAAKGQEWARAIYEDPPAVKALT